MRTLIALILALVALAHTPCHAAKMHVTKGLTHYARDMEYYYQKPRAEVLPGLLRTLAGQGVLGHGEKRLVTAAFLAELARERKVSLEQLRHGTLAFSPEAGADARRTLAWAAHLAALPDEKQLLDSLLTEKDATLRGQISRSPAPLSAWPVNEPAVPRMFWGAYMASGNPLWLDRLLDETERYATLNAAGRQGEPGFAACAAAAALLYDMAPRHARVAERARARLGRASGPGAEALRLILREGGR